ncbi:MAG TPA: universal stress protein [Ignavibacteriaceae bacterium]|nr:universal stress protein [Ignavibacteriaceae bacterium]
MVFSNVLIPTDFSFNSAKAYEFALNFAKKNSARLHVLHVIEPIIRYNEINDPQDKMNLDRDRIFGAEEELERFINKFYNAGIDIFRIVIAGKPFEEIINYSKKEHVDLIITATHGKTNLHHLVAGNVTKKLLKFSVIPIVCIKTNPAVHLETTIGENLAENWVG